MEHEERFLNSETPLPSKPSFEALGRQGSSSYVGLETFDNPGCTYVQYTSDEVVATCPITGQPDYYTCKIALKDTEKLIESKSLKLFFNNIHEAAIKGDFGLFCEGLAVFIRDQVVEILDTDEEHVMVTLTQKSRGGIEINAVA